MQDQQKANCLSKVQMEHDKNAIISDDDGTMGDGEGAMDVDPEETTPKLCVLAHNMRIAQFKQQLAEVERSTPRFMSSS